MNLRNVRAAELGYLFASVFLHLLLLGAAARFGFQTPADQDEFLVAVTPRFAGEPVAWVARGSSPASSSEPAALETIEVEPELPDWAASVRASVPFAGLASLSYAQAALLQDVPAESDLSEPEDEGPESPVEPVPVAAETAPVELEKPDLVALGAPATAENAGGSGASPDARPSAAEEIAESSATQAGSDASSTPVPASAPASARAESGPGREAASVPDGDQEARALLEAPPPVYPRLSVRAGEEGTVVCRLHVSTEGDVLAVDVVTSSGHPRLDRAAVEALRAWRFVPRRHEDGVVPATILHQVTFRLES